MIFLALTVSRQTIEDIRGPFTADNAAWSIALIGMLLVLAGVAYFFWPNSKPKATLAPLPREIARNRLNQVRAVSEIGTYDLAIGLSTILRAFVEQQYGLKAVSRTTQEFLTELGTTSCLTPLQKGALQQFFLTVDQVKFARTIPSGDRSNLVEQAVNFIEQAP